MSLALLSKRPSPSLCSDVNSCYPVTLAWGETSGDGRTEGEEKKNCLNVLLFFTTERKVGTWDCSHESVLQGKRNFLVPELKTKAERTGHNSLSPAGLLRSLTSSSSSMGWNVRNPTGLGFWCRGPNLTLRLTVIFFSSFYTVFG